MSDQKIENKTNEEIMWPPRIDYIQVWLTSAWSIISWFVGSIVIIISIYFFLKNAREITWVYPFIYAITAFFASLFSAWLNIFLNKTINPDKYKRWSLAFAQIFLFYIFMFIFFLPCYIYATSVRIEYLVYVFSIHMIIAMLWASLFTEILSNYRYVLLWIYWSFIWSLVAILATSVVLLTFQESAKNLYILIWLSILVNFFTNTVRAVFEYVYYIYYSKTWMDQLWDIYYQIELEEKEIVEKARKSMIDFAQTNVNLQWLWRCENIDITNEKITKCYM